MQSYSPEYSNEALATFLKLSKRSALKLHSLCGRLAEQPHRQAEYIGHDEAGRPLSLAVIDGVGIYYWVDDAVCSVIIVKLQLPRRRQSF
ncbi:MAG TPA: hypothetical protein VIO38_04040 [Rariglobus sp.]